MKNDRGFTLLELIIVVVVIGILASLALPNYMRVTERARAAEAKSILGAIRSSQYRQMAMYGNYTADYDSLDMNVSTPMYFGTPTAVQGGDCSSNGGQSSGCLGYIQRNTYQGQDGQYWVAIDVNGNITFDGCATDPSCAYLQ